MNEGALHGIIAPFFIAVLHLHVGGLLAHAVSQLPTALGALHLNLVAHGFLLVFGHHHMQHAVLKLGLNLAWFHGVGQLK